MDMAEMQISRMKREYLSELATSALADLDTAKANLDRAHNRVQEVVGLTEADVIVVSDFGRLEVGLKKHYPQEMHKPKRVTDLGALKDG
jgi:hypothetical protein